MKINNCFLSASLLFALLFLAGCTPPAPQKRIFWPADAREAKIEYVGFYVADADVVRGKEHPLVEIIFGRNQPKPIFSRPMDVASDGRGRVMVSDAVQRDVLILDLNRKEIRPLRQSEPNAEAFASPWGIAIGSEGELYVVDPAAKKVFRFGSDEKFLGSFGHSTLVRPTGLALDEARQRLYVADPGAHAVAVFTPGGEYLQSIGRRGRGEGEFNFPVDIDLDPDGNLYVLDSLNARVQVLDPQGNFLRSFGERGSALGSFSLAKGLAVSRSGHVYVTDAQANKFVIFDLQGNHLMTIGSRAIFYQKVVPGGLNLPIGIDVDAQESIWVVDSLNGILHRFQYLNQEYLGAHPIDPEQMYVPETPFK